MKVLVLWLAVSTLTLVAGHEAVARMAGVGGGVGGGVGDAINTTCPVSKEPIDGETFVEHDGHRIGLCCGGCRRQFAGWDEQRKAAFVTTALGALGAGDATSRPAGATSRPAGAGAKGGLYTLDTCPVSGEKLGDMGDAVVKVYDGREVRFCCGGCVGKFEADREAYLEAIDEKLVKQQRPYYPLETCVVTGEPLVEDGKDTGVDVIVSNRLLRTCCKSCARKVRNNPGRYLAKLDEVIVSQQRPRYPLDVCPVSGQKLGSMGEPTEVIAGNLLLRFCCDGCRPAFEKTPTKYIAIVGEAWRKRHGDGHDRGH